MKKIADSYTWAETPPGPSKTDTLYPYTLCYQIKHHDASEIYYLEVELHCRHKQVTHTHTLAVHLSLELFASIHTTGPYEWELNCWKTPSQNQQGDRSAAQPGSHIQTSCKRCDSSVSSQLTYSAKILPHTPLVIYHSITISINCSLLQHVNVGQTNSCTQDYCHLVPHLLAHVQINRTAAAQQPSNSNSHPREPKGQRPAHMPYSKNFPQHGR